MEFIHSLTSNTGIHVDVAVKDISTGYWCIQLSSIIHPFYQHRIMLISLAPAVLIRVAPCLLHLSSRNFFLVLGRASIQTHNGSRMQRLTKLNQLKGDVERTRKMLDVQSIQRGEHQEDATKKSEIQGARAWEPSTTSQSNHKITDIFNAGQTCTNNNDINNESGT